MYQSKNKIKRLLLVLLLQAPFFNLFYAEISASIGLQDLSTQIRFKLALEDAKLPTGFEINKNLIAINPTNYKISYDESRKKIKIVSFMSRAYLEFYLKQKTTDSFKTMPYSPQQFTLNNINFHLSKNDFNFIKNTLDQNIKPYNTYFRSNLDKDDFRSFLHQLRGYNVSWVTVAPEIINFGYNWIKQYQFNNKKKPSLLDIRTRINERLGLTTDHETEKIFVEMLIDPKNLFRPSSDSEIYDSTTTPTDSENFNTVENVSNNIFDDQNLTNHQKNMYSDPSQWTSTPKNRYTKWFNNERNGKYDGNWAMPWSQLGYTYDYSQEAFNSINPEAHFGCSEFCIKPESECSIVGIYSISTYLSATNYLQNKDSLVAAATKKIDALIEDMNNQENFISKRINSYSSILSIINDINTLYSNNSSDKVISIEKYKPAIESFNADIKVLFKENEP